MKLNLGSGTLHVDGWLSVDHRPEAKAGLTADAFALDGVQPCSVDEILASHILEHACFDRTRTILARWLAVLKPGGTLWLAVPNFQKVLQTHLKDYLEDRITWEYFNSRIFGNPGVAKTMYGAGMVSDVPGIHKYELAFHRAVFTPAMLADCLTAAGFDRVELLAKLPQKSAHSDEICIKGRKPC